MQYVRGPSGSREDSCPIFCIRTSDRQCQRAAICVLGLHLYQSDSRPARLSYVVHESIGRRRSGSSG